ncbi:MAG: Tol biopolymer transport system component [Gammaproteobacteria bacterium]|jgi:Tol biopolymer transport system component
MSLANGQTLSFYQILSPLGAGGMGEVYLARDTRLDREVAIKVLPEEMADDEERLRRFEREAKTLASLNHTNIAGIHGIDQVDETCFIAMELVPGEDLEVRLKRGALPAEEALDVCRQIAEGLEIAHEAGIVHRDLKPANIRITPEGLVKILDFGLAKPIGSSARKSGSQQLPSSAESDSFLVTSEGMILGTPTYMSPEQARGKLVDRRTDIWAFGCVLFECLTGKRAFKGDAFGDLIAAILGREVDLEALPSATPPRVRELIARCVVKDPRMRLRDIGEARVVLGLDDDGPALGITAKGVTTRRGSGGFAAVGALLLGALLARAFWTPSPPSRTASMPLVAELIAPDGMHMGPHSGPPVVSLDGKRLAFVAIDEEGNSALWVRELDGIEEARQIPGSKNADNPFWAPDGRRLGFMSGSDLLTIGVDEDRPQFLFRGNPGTVITGAAWNEENKILFAPGSGPFLSVDALGGTPEVAFDHSPDRESARAMWPSFLPDGKSFLFMIQDGGGEVSGLYVGEIGSTTARLLLPEKTNAVYVEPGWIVHRRGDALYAQAFDPRTHALGEEAVRLAKDVRVLDWPAHALFGASRDGRIVYYPNDASVVESEFVWFDLASGSIESMGVEGVLWNPRLSHDGKQLAFDRTSLRTSGDVWVRDLARGSEVRLTEAVSDDSSPVWTPNDEGLYFFMTPDLFYAKASGVGGVERILESAEDKSTVDLSADGRTLLWVSGERAELFALDLETRESTLLLRQVESASLSPDGAWLAVELRASGKTIVALQTYPGGEHFTRISAGSGTRPCWAPSGSEILFESEGQVAAVPVELHPGAAPVLGESRVVVSRAGPNRYILANGFEVSNDGQKLLLIRSLASTAGALSVIENSIPKRP